MAFECVHMVNVADIFFEPTYGCEPTREAAMAFAKSWRRE
jgi:hypothetical protein